MSNVHARMEHEGVKFSTALWQGITPIDLALGGGAPNEYPMHAHAHAHQCLCKGFQTLKPCGLMR